jgi:uncharacterized protein YndB with AHSA1/START domain
MTTPIEISVSRIISARPEQVYDLWLDPKSAGSPWFGAERVILNPVVDGLYYFAVQHEGRTWAHYGRFLRLDRPRVIEQTWMSEATGGRESTLTATFEPGGDCARVTLRHTNLPDDVLGRQHEEGWTFVLGAIADRFGSRAR